MNLRVLGCSGGIGAALRTTSFLLDDDILLDVGTGIGDLSLDELRKIRHIFITHSHLDHLAGLPLLVDTLLGLNSPPIVVHALPETLQTLQQHIFNWKVWPDFAELPDKKNPSMRYVEMNIGDTVELNDRKITMLPAVHSVPAAAYSISNGDGTFAFSGDNSSNDVFWDALNKIDDLKILIIECAFANKDCELAALSKHYCPSTLSADLQKLKSDPRILITHLKPGNEALIIEECLELNSQRNIQQLQHSDIISF